MKRIPVLACGLLLAPVLCFAHENEGPQHKHDGKDANAKAPTPAPVPEPKVTGVIRWVDDGGIVHYSMGIDNVPERFRPTVQQRIYRVQETTPGSGKPEEPSPQAAPTGKPEAAPAKK